MNFNFSDSFLIKRVQNKEGTFGYLANHKDLDDDSIIKIIKCMESEKEDIINFFLANPFIKDSGQPIDDFRVDDRLMGYVERYYRDALTFNDAINSNKFSYKERLNASIQVSKQLREIHKHDLLFNDICLQNQLIDKNSGHLIDFDAVTTKDINSFETHYVLKSRGKELDNDSNMDKLKQAITNLSLIYQIDIEEIILYTTRDVNNIIGLFKDNRDIFNLLNSYLDIYQDTPYFDILEKNLADEEKTIFEAGKVRQKINRII